MKISDAMKGMDVIRQTARHYGVTEEEVRRDMQEALDAAWGSSDPEVRAFQEQLFPDGKPCLEDFIITLGKYMKER